MPVINARLEFVCIKMRLMENATEREAPVPFSEGLPPELRFLAACCAWPPSASDGDRLSDTIGAIKDWSAVLAAVARHRVAGLVNAALVRSPQTAAGVPEDVRAMIAVRARAIQLRSLRQAQELLAIGQSFAEAGISMIELKGLTLGKLAYGTISRKASHDLDLLVSVADAGRAIGLLYERGYRLRDFASQLSSRQIRALVCNRRDIQLLDPDGAIVELHWKPSYASTLLKGLPAASPRQRVAIGNDDRTMIDTLATPDLVAYLAVHGTLHGWFRLKWLADVGALLLAADAQELALIRQRATELGAGRALAVTEALVGELLGVPASPPEVPDASVQAIVRVVRHTIMDPMPETTKGFVTNLFELARDVTINRRLFEGASQAKELLDRYLFVEADILAIPLPDRLRGLYIPLRWPLWAWRHLRGFKSAK